MGFRRKSLDLYESVETQTSVRCEPQPTYQGFYFLFTYINYKKLGLMLAYACCTMNIAAIKHGLTLSWSDMDTLFR